MKIQKGLESRFLRLIRFSRDFLFGAGICDYQHFGGTTCDLPVIPASKHSIFFEEDFGLLKELGLTSLRTSIEWARIEPKEGKIDENSIRFYHHYFQKLRRAGVTTIVTLHHFTNPRWIHKYGGWVSEKTVKKFLKFVDFVSKEYGKYIDYYVTINEPTIYASFAYMTGAGGLPPYHRNPREAKLCLGNMNEAIRRGYEIIHERSKRARVGVAQAGGATGGWRNLFRLFFTRTANNIWIDNPIESWEGKFDFCGINYYFKKFLNKPSIYPEGLRKICKELFKRHRKPILITENGFPNRDDRQKTVYLLLHLKSLADAIIKDKAKIIGYCWWSFLHGYEWGFEYKPFFALINVDIDRSYRRTLTKTACIYSEIIKNRGFPQELYEKSYPFKSSLKFENWP